MPNFLVCFTTATKKTHTLKSGKGIGWPLTQTYVRIPASASHINCSALATLPFLASSLDKDYLLAQIVDAMICLFISIVTNSGHCVKPYQDDSAASAGYPAMAPPCPGSSPRELPAVAYSGNAADAVPPRKPCSRRRSLVPA